MMNPMWRRAIPVPEDMKPAGIIDRINLRSWVDVKRPLYYVQVTGADNYAVVRLTSEDKWIFEDAYKGIFLFTNYWLAFGFMCQAKRKKISV